MSKKRKPVKLVQVGIRDFSEDEFNLTESRSDMKTFFDQHLKNELYAGRTWKSLCEKIVAELPKKIHVSFDIDGFDPVLCPNTGTPVPGGLQFGEANSLLKTLVESGRQIVSFDLASGRQTDLTDYLPADWIGTGTPELPLYDLYLATLGPQLTDDCRQGLERAMTDRRLRFDIGPDSGQQRLLVLPVGLPPADAACAVPAGVDAATLAAAGFAPNLIRAVRGTMP